MGSGEVATTRELLDRLPTPAEAPILEKLDELGYEKFREECTLETPIDPETGIVDHDALIAMVGGLVSDAYKWKAPFFDEHHLHWHARSYEEHPEDPRLAKQFRNLPIHKIWVPRQFHDFTHLVTKPPEVPRVETMRRSVKDFRRKQYLFTIATGAIELRERTMRMRRHEMAGRVYFIDPLTRRSVTSDDTYESRRDDFIHYIEQHHRRGLIDLSAVSPVRLRGKADIEDLLPEIREFAAAGIIRARGVNARRTSLPVDRAA